MTKNQIEKTISLWNESMRNNITKHANKLRVEQRKLRESDQDYKTMKRLEKKLAKKYNKDFYDMENQLYTKVRDLTIDFRISLLHAEMNGETKKFPTFEELLSK